MPLALDLFKSHAATNFWSFLNSEFISAMLGALAGALAGAYGGAWIVERQGQKKRLVEEVRATNIAISLSIFTMNAILTIKKQHIQGMVDIYGNHRKEFDKIINGGKKEEFSFQGDWETLPLMELPLAPLRDAIYSKIDATHSTIAAFSAFEAANGHFSEAIRLRNDFIKEIQTRVNPLSTIDRLNIYFGLRQDSGIVDARYPTMLEAASNYVDAAALFSAVLAALLIKHGQSEVRKLGKKAPKIISMNISNAFSQKLMPEPEEFGETLRGMGVDPQTILAGHR
jgi:hypothetical protein